MTDCHFRILSQPVVKDNPCTLIRSFYEHVPRRPSELNDGVGSLALWEGQGSFLEHIAHGPLFFAEKGAKVLLRFLLLSSITV